MTLSLRKRGNIFHAEGEFMGERIRRSLKTSDRMQAKDAMLKLQSDLLTGSASKATKGTPFSVVADKYMKSRRTGSSKSATRYAEHHREMFGGYDITEIDEDLIEGYIEDYHAPKGNSDGTIRRDLVALQGILNFGAKLKLRDHITVEKPSENPHSIVTITPEEQTAIFNSLLRRDRYSQVQWGVHKICTFLIYTGARPNEVLKLRFADLDLTNNTVILRSIKGRKGQLKERRVPLHPDLVAALPKRPNHKTPQPSDLVFDYGLDTAELRRRFKRAAEKVGIEDKTPYCLRHTFATRLCRQGVPPKVVADLLGHSSLDMVMKYMNTTFEDHQSAILGMTNLAYQTRMPDTQPRVM